MRKRAFTLIELLVVIAIIAILAALLFPVFAKAKLAAKKSNGLAQLKQIGTAVQIYAADYDDGLPTWNSCLAAYQSIFGFYPDPECTSTTDPYTGTWGDDKFWDYNLNPYVKNGKPEDGDFGGIWASPLKEYEVGRSIGMNQLIFWDVDSFFSGGTCYWGESNYRYSGCYFYIKQGQIVDPADTVFAADTGTGGRYEPMYFLNGYAERFWTSYSGYGAHVWAQPWRYDLQGANYSFLDGHAKHFQGDQMYPNPQRQDTLAFPTSTLISLYCNVVKYQAPTYRMKQDFIDRVRNVYGGDCMDTGL